MPKRHPKPAAPALTPLPATSRRTDFFGIVALLLLALPWWIAATCPLIHLDDGEYVTRNAHVLGGISTANLHWAFANVDLNLWQPLTWVSLMLDVTLFGPGPLGFHITNILLHLANMLLLYAFLRLLLVTPARSFLIAALWAMHPLRVESVAWVTERKDVLSGFFGLLALCAYIKYARRPRFVWYMPVLIFMALSLLAKATLITLPALLLLLDFWPLARFTGNKTARFQRWFPLLEKLPLACLSIAMVVITFFALTSAHAAVSQAALPISQRAANIFFSYLLYLRDMFYFGRLSIYYPFQWVTADEALFAVSLFVIMTTALIWAAIKSPHRFKPVLFGWLWFVIALLPASGILQSGGQARADRFTYIPSIGLAIAFVTLCPTEWFTAPRTRLGFAAATMILIALTAYTSLQLALWRDPLALYLDGIAHTQNNAQLFARAGDALAQSGSLDNAEEYYRHSLSINPNDGQTHNNLGSLYAKEHRFPEALREFGVADQLEPWDAVIDGNYRRMMREHPG
ncbi:MAG TPA: hypothetical protein VGN88_13580 [Phycisphaerae bacterium]|jgi:tetratricopeptide (TPR) repeat protein